MRYNITNEFDEPIVAVKDKDLAIELAKHLNRNVWDTIDSVEIFHYTSWQFEIDKFLYSIPDREPQVICTKCGKNDVVNKQKYCGNGSDKENAHRWFPIPEDKKEQEILICKELREKYKALPNEQ